MATPSTFKEIKEAISSILVDTTRTAGQIAGEDLAFHRSSNPEITPLIEKQNSRLLQLAQNLVRVSASGTEVPVPRLPDADAVEDNWRGIVDVIDNLLEKADACLDEYTGVIQRLPASQEIPPPKSSTPVRKQVPSRNFRNQNIPKPQLQFEKIPTNDETTPFMPLLRSKPHNVVPLEQSLGATRNSGLRPNPYQTEIAQSKYPASTYLKSDPIPYLPLKSTEAKLVDTPEAVTAMLEELRAAKEIAVDLEHHDTHSYVGLVSLMQISTRDKDWIVDTLKPWREELQVLNEVFADPNILKVLHGSSMDIIWLQRDLGLYVVGLFDTYHASRILGYTKHSLASLLTRFVGFDADKQYQMADWRIRPLPDQMFDYARSDTHFLLYVYDNMRNELIERSDSSQPDGNLVEEVLKRSKEEASQRYERPTYDAEHGKGVIGWYNILYRTPALLSKEQFAVFRAVHRWRDTVARHEDESVHHVMPRHVLFSIAREMPLDKPSLLGCSHPISSLLRERAGELLGIVRNAKIAGATGPELMEIIQDREANRLKSKLEAGAADNGGLAIVSAADQAVPPTQTLTSKLPIRINRSQFWGSTMSSTAGNAQISSLRLALPLPQLTAQIFDDKQSVTARSSQVEPGARAEHQFVRERKPIEDDVFVVKQLGGSRKRKVSELQDVPILAGAPTDNPTLNGTSRSLDKGTEISLNKVDEEQVAREKAERKAQRKAQKKLGKEQYEGEKSKQGDGTEGQVESEAFDYANAPSVLHAKRDNNDRTGSKKSFDPYAKSLDAPKGMRKSKKEIAGKSFTFKK